MICQGTGVSVTTVVGHKVMELERGPSCSWAGGENPVSLCPAGPGMPSQHTVAERDRPYTVTGNVYQESSEDILFPFIPWESDSSLGGLDAELQAEFWGQTLYEGLLADDLSMDIQDSSEQATDSPPECHEEAYFPFQVACNGYNSRTQEQAQHNTSCTSECSGLERNSTGGGEEEGKISSLLSPCFGLHDQRLDQGKQMGDYTTGGGTAWGKHLGEEYVEFEARPSLLMKPESSLSDGAAGCSNELVGSSFTGLKVPAMHGDSRTETAEQWNSASGWKDVVNSPPNSDTVPVGSLRDCTTSGCGFELDKRPAKKRRMCGVSPHKLALDMNDYDMRKQRCRRNSRSVRNGGLAQEWGHPNSREGIKQSGVLKKFSGLVINEIRLKKVTTCSELVEKLIKQENEHANTDYVKRRVYDIINVLEAIGMIKKDEQKRVLWKGWHNAGNPESEIENLEDQIGDLQISINKKAKCEAQLKNRYDAVMALIRKNRHRPILKEDHHDDIVPLPFVLARIGGGGDVHMNTGDEPGDVIFGHGPLKMYGDMDILHELSQREIHSTSHVNIARDPLEPLTPSSSNTKIYYDQTPLSLHNPPSSAYATFPTQSTATRSSLIVACSFDPKAASMSHCTFQKGSREDSLTDSHSVANGI